MASEYRDYGRIHHVAFKVAVVTLFAVAMIAAIGRFTIRLSYKKRLFADDYILLFGCSSLISSIVLTFVSFEYVYLEALLTLGPTDSISEQVTAPGFAKEILRFHQLTSSSVVLYWVTIFAVKFSYLLFFYPLLSRLRGILTYWKVTMGIVVVSGAFCVCEIFIGCPHVGPDAVVCSGRSGFLRLSTLSWIANASNILTDLLSMWNDLAGDEYAANFPILVVIVPIITLRKVKIQLYKKITLGTLLSLSLCMIAITLIRVAHGTVKGHNGDTLDVQWYLFWHSIEASVAVTVVSLTAFRSLYSFKSSKKSTKQREPWLSSRSKTLASSHMRRKVDEFGDWISNDQDTLPEIPRPALTGICSFRDRNSWIPIQEDSFLSANLPQLTNH